MSDTIPDGSRLESSQLWKTLQAEIADYPVVEEAREAWDRIAEEPRLGARMKCALRFVAGGLPYRKAAEMVQYADHAEVWRTARRFGLAKVRTDELIEQGGRIAWLAGDEMERRIVEDSDELGLRDLAVARGIEMDKRAKRENWGRDLDGRGSFTSAFDSAWG